MTKVNGIWLYSVNGITGNNKGTRYYIQWQNGKRVKVNGE